MQFGGGKEQLFDDWVFLSVPNLVATTLFVRRPVTVAATTRRAKHLLFSRNVSISSRKNKSLCENQKHTYIPSRPAPTTEGVSRSLRHVARDAMDAHLTQSGRWMRVRSSRVVLIPRRWDQANAIHSRRGLKSPVPRGERGAAVKPLRRECRMFRPACQTCGRFPFQPTSLAGAVERPAFPAPSHLRRDTNLQNSGESPPREREAASKNSIVVPGKRAPCGAQAPSSKRAQTRDP